MSRPPEEPSSSAPEARTPAPGAGIVGAMALVAALGATLLWLTMLIGPWRLATGLIDAKFHIDKVQTRLSKSDLKKGRYESLAATAAIGRARSGLAVGEPILDIARIVPPVDSALHEIGHIVSAADHSAKAAEATVVLTGRILKGRHRVVVRDRQNPKDSVIRLDEVAALGDSIHKVHTEVTATRQELQAVNLHNLPRRARPSVTDGITKAKDTEALLSDAEAGFKVLPGFLGANGPRTYLFGMQNNAEQRGTGGALLQFTTLTIANGKPTLGHGGHASSTVYKVDKYRQPLTIPLPKDAWYVRNVPDAERFGNANWAPDWPLSAQLTAEYGAESARQNNVNFPKIDGVIAVDPLVMQDLLRGTGRYRTNTCKNRVTQDRIVEFLFYRAYASFPNPRQRRGCLKGVVDGFYENVVRPKSTSKLFSGMGTALADKHMQMWMRDPAEERFVKHMKWDGEIQKAAGDDYLDVIEQNVGGNKLDFYSENTTTSAITIDGSDAVHSTEVRVRNGVFLPQPRFAMGDTGNLQAYEAGVGNVHRPMMNLYVPGTASLEGPAVVHGSDARVRRIDAPPVIGVWPAPDQPVEHVESGKKVWSGTLEIPPQQEGAFTFDYRVPGVVHEAHGREVYRLNVQHQPKVRPETLSLNLTLPEGATKVKAPGWKDEAGHLVWDGPLIKDMVLEVSWRK
jgi:hypothetical protein